MFGQVDINCCSGDLECELSHIHHTIKFVVVDCNTSVYCYKLVFGNLQNNEHLFDDGVCSHIRVYQKVFSRIRSCFVSRISHPGNFCHYITFACVKN